MASGSRRIVVKCGTGLLADAAGVNDGFIANIARQVGRIRAQGVDVALVTSGAVAAGRSIVPLRGQELVTRQVLAAIGQAPLIARYAEHFARQGMTVAQALVSRADLDSRSGYLNARNALIGLLDNGVVPITNENDVVATEELRFGDNDTLSVLIAKLVGADRLCILSTIGGLFTSDPRRNADARLIAEAGGLPRADLARMAGGASDGGSGGMRSKVQAAADAAADGIDVVIADGTAPDVLVRIETGERLGTHFAGRGPLRSSRARWLSSGLTQRGAVMVDQGARRAVERQGRSLLPAGIVRVEGAFERGDLVGVLDPGREVFARGLVNYDAPDLARICGLGSGAIKTALGYSNGDEAIHRNNLVVMGRGASHGEDDL